MKRVSQGFRFQGMRFSKVSMVMVTANELLTLGPQTCFLFAAQSITILRAASPYPMTDTCLATSVLFFLYCFCFVCMLR